jgi:hypothetical protein
MKLRVCVVVVVLCGVVWWLCYYGGGECYTGPVVCCLPLPLKYNTGSSNSTFGFAPFLPCLNDICLWYGLVFVPNMSPVATIEVRYPHASDDGAS